MDVQQPDQENKDDEVDGKSTVATVLVARRCLRGIGLLQIIAFAAAATWLSIALLNCPVPDTFTTRGTYSGVESLRDQLIEDLRSNAQLQTFAPEDWAVEADGEPRDYSWIRMLVEWGKEDSDNPEEMQKLSSELIQEYRGNFSSYRLTILYLAAATVTGLFCTLVLVLVTKLSIAALTLAVSCSLLPPVSELLVGRDFGDTVFYSLPFIIMSLTMFGCEFCAWWVEQIHRAPSAKDAWVQIWIGGVLFLGATGHAAFEIFSDSDLSYRATQGLGAGIAGGLWCLIDGVRDFFRTRKTDSTARHPND